MKCSRILSIVVLGLSIASFAWAGPQQSTRQMFKTFDNYSSTPLMLKFNIGYEYVTVDSTFQKGFPRIGMTLYAMHFQEDLSDKGGLTFGIHNSLTALLTSSAEQETKGSLGGTAGIKNMGDKQALDFDAHFFFPLLKTQRAVQLVGPVLMLGGRKVDENPKFEGRYYGGIRMARNPEMYADVMYGKTESLSSSRLEARGQLPIYKDWLFLGAIGNFGIKDRETSTEADSMRIYLTWNVDAQDIFGRIFNLLHGVEGKVE